MIEMMDHNTDPLIEAPRALEVAPPPTLAASVVDHWLCTDSVLGPVFVGFTARGISFVRSAAGSTESQFRESYRARFGRPLLVGDAGPVGLELALLGRSGDTPPALDLRGLTDFQREILLATASIPRGETRPYGWVARQVGRPNAVRAAGTALADNPVPLLIPCHRVVRGDGSPGQYIFGSTIKQALLRHEDARVGNGDLDG